MRVVLDTSLVIEAAPEPIEGELAISMATLAELHFGVLVAKNLRARADRLSRLAEIENTLDALPVDEAVAASYGVLTAAVAATGRQPRRRVMDLLIAATAHAHSARLYTRNSSDLVGVEDLVEIVRV